MQETDVPKNKVRIIAKDCSEFVIDHKLAMLSQTLSVFFNEQLPFREAATRTVTLPVKTKVLKRIIEFMEYKYNNIDNAIISEFKISDEETVDLLDVASYLGV